MTHDTALACPFEPIDVGSVHLPHRIAMAPMTRFRCGEDGVPASYVGEYYAQRASAALIVGESVYTIPSARMFLQIIHGGRGSHPGLQPDN